MSEKEAAKKTLRALAAGKGKDNDPIVAARVGGELLGLGETVDERANPLWVALSSPLGERIYRRSVLFLVIVAMRELYGAADTELIVRASLNDGLYCDLEVPGGVTDGIVSAIEVQMRAIIAEDREIGHRVVPKEEAVRIFKAERQIPKANLLNALPEEEVVLCTCGEHCDDLYGVMLDRTGSLGCFDLVRVGNGVLLRTPRDGMGLALKETVRQPKFTQTLKDSKRWAKVLHCEYLPDLNRSIQLGRTGDLIRVSEALHEKKIAEIADRIAAGIKKARLVMIAGPSSSGKTSFAQRLKVQLRVNGLTPISISLDDYFVNRVDTPKFPDGSYDFDNFDTVDHEYLQQDVLKLLNGEEVSIPTYNFVTGLREYNNRLMKLDKDSVLLVEGIHALNPQLTDQVPEDSKFRIFINTITSLSLDDHNFIPTSDIRLLRRIVRDYNKGAFSARETIAQWPNVRGSESLWIYPYQEVADVLFNSSYLIELAVLRNNAQIILGTVPKNCPEYSEAHRLLKFLSYFIPVPDKEIPPTSLMREYVGGSSFKY